MEALRADLVMEGGGVLGIGHVGAVEQLEQAGYAFERVAGSSVGALVGSLVAGGMPARRLVELMRETDFRRFTDRSLVDRVPVLGPLASLILDDGFYEGDWLHSYVGDVLRDECGVETFGDLRRAGDDVPLEERWKLVVTVTDVTRGLLVRLPWDYQRVYGLDPDEQPVADAVRASTSIPFFFEPSTLTAADGLTSTLVDGGVLANFPIDLLDRTGPNPPRWPTFGVKLVPNLPEDGPALLPVLNLIPGGPLGLLSDLVTTTLVGRDQARLSLPWVAARTIRVDTAGVNPVDFRLSDTDKERLLDSGRHAAEAFLTRWDWTAYKKRFRDRREG